MIEEDNDVYDEKQGHAMQGWKRALVEILTHPTHFLF
jgi:hypothetical protein